MRLSLLTAGAALLLCQTAAMAQTTTPPANANNQQPAASSANASGGQLRAHVQNMLQSAGFSDIRMMPSSFMIRAKDQEGNPVVMSVSPNSFTEVSELGTSNGGEWVDGQRRRRQRVAQQRFPVRIGRSE